MTTDYTIASILCIDSSSNAFIFVNYIQTLENEPYHSYVRLYSSNIRIPFYGAFLDHEIYLGSISLCSWSSILFPHKRSRVVLKGRDEFLLLLLPRLIDIQSRLNAFILQMLHSGSLFSCWVLKPCQHILKSGGIVVCSKFLNVWHL